MNPYQQQQQEPQWVSASTAEMDLRVRAFIRSVYGWMFGGLLLTALASAWVVVSPAMQRLVLANPIVFIGLIIAELGLVIAISAGINRFSPGTTAAMFFVYSVINGLTLSVVLFAYSQSSVMQAFLTAAGMFGAMSIYGTVTKRDLTSWGSFFFMGLIGVVLCMFVNFFIRSSGLSFVISIVGVFVFLGLTAYDTQKLRAWAMAGGPAQENLAIRGALRLYLDFINLFLLLLRLFGGNRR